ncbi:MAG: carboxyl transferase [Lachnospiraceae bacterium]|nr:carboxyl transferase [Roseburia sp.]MBP3469083.1 carboxyl transferase [Lachnospiraceae bacterium]
MSTSTSSASQRIEALLDEKSFVEIGAKVTARATDFNLKQHDTPSDGVITGYGTIEGNRVYVYSQDASVIGGSIGEMHAKKICGIYDLALKTGTPVIGLIDSAGLRLQEATDALNSLGEIYFKQTMAKGVVPQITAIFGACGGGLAIVPSMTDFTFMESSKAKLFVNSPNALDGNNSDKNDTASAKFQAEESGIVDFTGSETEILAQIRELVSMIPGNNDDVALSDCNDDLNRICPDLAGCAGDTSILLNQIADDNYFMEVKAGYAKDMVTGFIRLDGMTVGCVANRTEVVGEDGKVAEKLDGVLSVNGCQKATDFIYFCDSFGIPVLSITNVKGYASTVCAEKRISKAVAEMTAAFADCDVPRVNVIVGKALGSAYVSMNSKSIGCDLTFAWPNAEIGTMDANLAAKIMYEGQGADVIADKAKEYAALQNNVESAAKRGYVDAVIEPQDTRKHLIYAFEMLYA